MNAECVSWDFRRAGIYSMIVYVEMIGCYLIKCTEWINQGCVTEFSPGSCDAVCNCSHLTNFAVLVVSAYNLDKN